MISLSSLKHEFYQDFLMSEGIELNASEKTVPDPYTLTRHQPRYAYTTPSAYDKLKQFLALDRKVLRFYCVWDDRDNMFGELKPHVRIFTCQCSTVEPPNNRHPYPKSIAGFTVNPLPSVGPILPPSNCTMILRLSLF